MQLLVSADDVSSESVSVPLAHLSVHVLVLNGRRSTILKRVNACRVTLPREREFGEH